MLMLACTCVTSVVFGQAKPLAGSPGVIGTPARLGKYQFTLTGASFATRIGHSTDTVIAEKGKKFLVLNFSVQNPGKDNLPFVWDSIRFTVVSADNVNHENAETVMNPETMARIDLELKPAQKVPAMTWVEVPAADPIPKLMAISGDAPALRFDLKGKVKKFTGRFADPNAVTVLDAGSVTTGEKVELGHFDFTVEKVEEVMQAVGDVEPAEGQKLIVVTIAYSNPHRVPHNLDWSSYALEMKDLNNEVIEYRETLYRAVGDAQLSGDVKPGETVRGRLLFAAPKKVTAGSLLFTWPAGRRVKVSLK